MRENIGLIFYGIRTAIGILKTKKEKAMVVALWGISLMSYVTSLLMLIVQKMITNGVYSFTTDTPQYSVIIGGIAIYAVCSIIGFILRANASVWTEEIKGIISDTLLGNILTKSTKIKYRYFEDNKTYEKLSNITNNVPNKLSDTITWRTVPPLIGGIVSLIFTTSLLVGVSGIIAILVAIGNILSIVFYYKRMRDNYYLQRNQIPQRRVANEYWRVLTERAYAKEMSFFNIKEYVEEKWRSISIQASKENYRFAVKYSKRLFISDFIQVLFKMVALGYTCYLIIDGKTSIGSFMLVYGSLSVFNGYMSDISNAFISLGENTIYIKDWIEYMELEEESCDSTENGEKGLDIHIENLKFKYKNSDKYAINGINLDIKKGEHIAVVGENGSGKSTFVSLLNMFYDDYEGTITLNGEDIRTQVAAVRRKFASVFQDFGKYEMSIYDNIRIGDLSKEYSRTDIENSIKENNIMDFNDDMPNGIDTIIGTYSESGIELSGGQWQKIAISRALIKKNAELLILDEPTAALDPYAESLIYEQFLKENEDKTCILISHRLGATKFADRIIVFDAGNIVEIGTHKELMEKRGKYHNMYIAQAKSYM